MVENFGDFKEALDHECDRRNIARKDKASLMEEFEKYSNFVDFFGKIGEIVFSEDVSGELVWQFAPIYA
ncbi:hypothetical protein [Yoonia sp. R2-816]|uniref:hypothetical protein n=1 Tax=Yoonia sp. R2-816 TaxID=3342638 RepID=UPI00372C5F69